MINKPDICKACPITQYTGTAFVPPKLGSSPFLILGGMPDDHDLVAGAPMSGGKGTFLTKLAAKGKIDTATASISNTICCRPASNIYPTDRKWKATSRADARAGLAYCRAAYLDPLLRRQDYQAIYALGDEALEALTTRRGILVWRGSPLPLRGNGDSCKVLPTIHPSKLFIDYKYTSAVIGDFKKSLKPPPENYALYSSPSDLANFRSKSFAFDFEWDYQGNITICGLADRFYSANVGSWSGDNLVEYRRIFEEASDLIGHNIIGADTRYLTKLAWDFSKAKLHDTMLKQHLVQPDYKHDLGFVSSVMTNKVFWKGRGKEEEDDSGNIIAIKAQWKTWNQPDAIPRSLGGYGGCSSADEAYRLYNARDTDASYQINEQLDRLLDYYKLAPVYWNVSLPIAHICKDIAERGIRIAPEKVKIIRAELGEELERLELTLPDGLRPILVDVTRQIPAPEGTYKPKLFKCKGTKRLGTAHETVTFTVYRPGDPIQCPTCGCIPKREARFVQVKKIKVPGTELVRPWNSQQKVLAYARAKGLKVRVNRKSGNDSADVKARKIWGRVAPEFQVIDKLKDISTERNNFAKQELEGLDRLFFNLLVHGTSEGRFSSSGQRPGIDPNIQNQPKSIRKIYIPEPGNSFIELDYASGENFLTAWLARDTERLARLYQPGYSEHLELAKRLFGLPDSVSKDEASDWKGQDLYGIGKVINHGSNYGMTHVKLQEELETNGFFYTERDCKEFLKIGEGLNPGTTIWKKATIELARRDGYLRNAFGRMRWFSTRDIATKSLAFLPASTLADIIIRAMIGHFPERFPAECGNLGLSVTGSMEESWYLQIQVHDSLVAQGKPEFRDDQLAKTRAIMCQPWRELGGFSLGVEAKAGEQDGDWGSLKKVKF